MTALPIYAICFYLFAAILVLSALMVIVVRNPVRAVLFLVLAFFASSALWMMMHAEFLSLALIFVYVGAVMTLFLFVVMMLNIDAAALRTGFVRYLPFAVLAAAVLCGLGLMAINTHHYFSGNTLLAATPAGYSNVAALGSVLYTKHVYALELAAAILLVAMVAAISLAFFGRKPHTKAQRIAEQVAARKRDRVRIVKMESEK